MNFYKYLIFILLSICAIVHAQDANKVVQGRVVDENGEPLAFASVVVATDSLGSRVKAFAITDEKGEFEIKNIANPENSWLSVRLLGHKSFKQRFNSAIVGDIVLAQAETQLKGVIVKAASNGVVMRGDTVVYNPAVFSNGSEQSLAEVIDKLPGLTIDDAGNVKYQGEAIDKILIDGKDVLGNSASTMIKTLPADFASALEIINNYKEGTVDEQFRTQDMLALNIKSEKKGKWKTFVNVAGGVKDKFDGRISVLGSMPKIVVTGVANANNTGETIFSANDYVMNVKGLKNAGNRIGSTTYIVSGAMAEAISDAANEYSRTGGVLSANIAVQTLPKYKLMASITGLGDKIKADNSNILEHLMYIEKNYHQQSKRDHLVGVTANQLWLPSDRLNIKAFTKFDMSATSDDNSHTDTLNALAYYTDMHGNVTNYKALQQLNFSLLVGNGLAYLNADWNFDYEHDKRRTEQSIILVDSDLTNYTYEAHNSNLFTTVGGIMPIGSHGIHIKFEAFGEWQYAQVKLHSDEETFTSVRPGAYVGLLRNEGLFRFDGGIVLTKARVDFDGSRSVDDDVFFLGPRLAFLYKPNKKSKLNVEFTRRISTRKPSDLSDLTRAYSINNIYAGSTVDDATLTYTEIAMRYGLNSTARRLVFSATFNATKTDDAIQKDYQSNGLVHIYSNANGGKYQKIAGSLSINKGLPMVPIYFFGNAGASEVNGNASADGTTYDMTSDNFLGKVGMNTQFTSSCVNGKVYCTYHIGRTSYTTTLERSKETLKSAVAELSYNYGNLSVSALYGVEKSKNNSWEENNSQLNLSVNYRIDKWTLFARGVDILNLNENHSLKQNVTPDYATYSRIGEMPGYILIGAKASL